MTYKYWIFGGWPSYVITHPEWHFSYTNITRYIVVSDYMVKMHVMYYSGILLPNTGYWWTEGIATHLIFIYDFIIIGNMWLNVFLQSKGI